MVFWSCFDARGGRGGVGRSVIVAACCTVSFADCGHLYFRKEESRTPTPRGDACLSCGVKKKSRDPELCGLTVVWPAIGVGGYKAWWLGGLIRKNDRQQ